MHSHFSWSLYYSKGDQQNIIPPKDYNNLPGTHPKDIEISDLPVKEFMIAILWKLNEL